MENRTSKIKEKAMGNLTPQHVQGHDQLNTDKYCQRCKSLTIKIQKNWTSKTHSLIAKIPPEFLKADCALCVQFCRVYNCLYDSLSHKSPLRLFYIHDGTLYKRGKTVGIEFQDLLAWHSIKFFPMQCTEFAYPPAVRRIVCPDEPDYEFIRTQLDNCKMFHGQACVGSTGGKQVLRVIDCKSRRLVTAKSDQPYACLSYVWGDGAAQEIHISGDELPAEMPKTIEDAMAVAVALEIPFLWIDRYCIDQGNMREKHDTIQNMNRIYEGAEITIIAACGDDPHHGLPGVRGTPRNLQLSLTLADTTFVAIESVHEEINTTKWAKRGWTYQEMLLSRRRLVFTKTQMYFQCGATHCMESLHPSFTTSDFALSPHFRAFPAQGIGHNVDHLKDRLTEYYMRQLSFDTDVINAFKGIISAFDHSTSFPFRLTHFYGVLVIYRHNNEHLTRRSFVANLCWKVMSTGNRDECSGLYHKPRSNLFPSWSWASTKTTSLKDYSSTPLLHSDMTGSPQCDDVQVCLTHKTDGDMDLHAFSKHTDGYEMFLPLIKLTTWILPWQLSRLSYDNHTSSAIGPRFELKPQTSCTTVYIAYLRIQSYYQSQSWIIALILEEVEPGVFRRIGRWDFEIDLIDGDWNSTTYDILDKALKNEFRPSSVNVDDGEAVSQLKWERKTVVIV